jgi:hypothetical protein
VDKDVKTQKGKIMRKLDTLTSLASAVINSIVADMDITSDEMSLYELYDDEGNVIGWYQSMTNKSVEEDFNIFIRVYVEIPCKGNKFWGELEILTPNKKRSHFDSLKVKVDGNLYNDVSDESIDENIDTIYTCSYNGDDILDEIEDRYEVYKKLLVAMM